MVMNRTSEKGVSLKLGRSTVVASAVSLQVFTDSSTTNKNMYLTMTRVTLDFVN